MDGAPGVSARESLAYLFDPNHRHIGKKAFPCVSGLLQVDSNGYYYYNASKAEKENGRFESANYAYFDETQRKFILYKQWGVLNRPKNLFLGQYFPFTSPKVVFDADESGSKRRVQSVQSKARRGCKR